MIRAPKKRPARKQLAAIITIVRGAIGEIDFMDAFSVPSLIFRSSRSIARAQAKAQLMWVAYQHRAGSPDNAPATPTCNAGAVLTAGRSSGLET